LSSRNGLRKHAPWSPGPADQEWWDAALDSYRRRAERRAVPTLPAATAEVAVEASPEDAFRLFTEEIGIWWRRDTPYWNDRDRGLSVRIEPGVGGRFMEVYDLDAGTGFEVGRVTAWEPGRRLALTWTQVGWPADVATDLEITFEPAGEGTLVRVEHTGFERVGPDAHRCGEGYAAGWQQVLGFFAETINRKEGA
jgi:uncharacterized protein YndB with AHSA1/START domain